MIYLKQDKTSYNNKTQGGSVMTKFTYNGPVLMFGRVVCSKYFAQTMAVGVKKALSNIAYRYKKEYGLVAGAQVTVDAKYLN